MHYVGALDDYPSETCAFPGSRGWAGRKGGNVLGAVRNVTDILEDWADVDRDTRIASEDDSANEALKFLVHFLGDLHMPLHLTGRDRGGNSDKVRFSGRITSKYHRAFLSLYKCMNALYRPPLPLGRTTHC